MPLHLIKLCVGADSIADLEEWIAERLAEARRRKRPVEQVHTTLRAPKRADEILEGGSLYWVIKGQVACRQRLTAIRPVRDEDGIERCQLVLDPVVQPVVPRPSRPFQGWRYLEAKDAPPDLDAASGEIAEMPEEMRRELRELGLI
jgi:hypothetical protein